MRARSRRAYSLFQLLVLLALVALVLGLMLPAIVKAQIEAARAQKANNLKQLVLATYGYHDTLNNFPSGVDDKQFSVLFHILPFIEQDNLYKLVDKTVDSNDKANARVRSTRVKAFESFLDPVNEKVAGGGTNFFAMAGTQRSLNDNTGVYYRDSKVRVATITDGTSNTVAFVEMLRGDGGTKAESVQRQHVHLKADDLKTLKEGDGVKDFANGKNIAANRGSAWIDGRFLQATTNATRGMLDKRPDVDCGGEGGLASVRMVGDGTHVGLCDGSVRWISPKVSFITWQKACHASDGNVPGDDW